MKKTIIDAICWGVTMFVMDIPVRLEIKDDINGDFNKKQDVWKRTGMYILAAVLCAPLMWDYESFPTIGVPVFSFIAPIVLGFGWFFLSFDYRYNKARGREDWFSYLGKKGWFDNLKFWRKIGANWRFAIKAITFILCGLFYQFVLHILTHKHH